MLLFLVKLRRVIQIVHGAVNHDPHEARLGGILQQLFVLAFSSPDDGGEDHQPGVIRHRLDGAHHLVNGLLADLLAALGAVGDADAGVQQAQVIMDFGHRAHGGAGVVPGGLLVDGDGGRKPFNGVHIRLFHLSQKLPGIAGQALHITPLALGKNGVKGQRGLAGTGQACEYDQFAPGKREADVLQVVLPGAFDNQCILHTNSSGCCPPNSSTFVPLRQDDGSRQVR